VAKRAGVGISALYSRYGSKDELLRELSRGGLERILEEINAALHDKRDPWNLFADFMRRLGIDPITPEAACFPRWDESLQAAGVYCSGAAAACRVSIPGA
jgi:AcrR family transcriptional regulator